MNCVESRELLQAHVDEELDARNRLELEQHLQTCADCAAATRSLRSLQTALRQPSLRYSAPASLRRAMHQLTAAPRTEPRPSWWQSLLFWKSLAFGATAFALLALLLRPGLSPHEQFLHEAVASHVRSLMANHLTDVASSDQHTVKPWFDGKVDFAPDVKDFAAQGFPLVGGRLDYLQGRPAAALVYRRNKHLINVFVLPAAPRGAVQDAAENDQGYSILHCAAGGLHYWLVSDLNARELGELAVLLGR